MDPNQPQGQLEQVGAPMPQQMGMPQPPMPPMPPMQQMPQQMPATNLPERMPPSSPMNTGNPETGHKKALLQKLMSNLLSKPGRSMHEMINGVKDAISAYKNYAKEWDNLTMLGGASMGAAGGGMMGKAVSGSGSGIQKILSDIQSKKQAVPKDGGGGPGIMPQAPAMVAPQTINPSPTGQPLQSMPPLPNMIAGPAQQSNFNRPAPVESLGIWGH